MGDRLFLTGGFRRDGVVFDAGQATALKCVSLTFIRGILF